MNQNLVFRLVELRYRLLWAQIRTRNGRIVLFLIGYFLAVLLIAFFAAGGFDAGIVAVRSGKAELVARIALGSVYVNALMIAVLLGFGVNSAFTDLALRRYPITANERLAARHLIAFLDPVWFIVLGLELGLVAGLYVFNTATPALGALAVLLLVLSNYLLARVLLAAIDRLMHVRGGIVVLGAFLMLLCFGPGLLAPRLARNKAAAEAVLQILRFTPPFAAAAVLVGKSLLAGLAQLAAWIAGLIAALAAFERRLEPARGTASAKISWDSWYERLGSLFGPAMGPLVARSLRYYLRSNRVRFNYLLTVPALMLVTLMRPSGSRLHLFPIGLCIFAVCGFMSTAAMSSNQFGYDGSGFRRYFLLPSAPQGILRASSYTAMFLGAVPVLLGVPLWLILAPVRFDARMPLMLLASGFAGLFVFSALALWTSVLWPRRTEFEQVFGNNLSLMANVLVIGGIFLMLFGAVFLEKHVAEADLLRAWWISIPAVPAAAAVYSTSLRRAGDVFARRRERLLNILEGRQ
jgi:hypothetical protein